MAKSVKDLPAKIQKLIVVNQWDMRTHDGVKRFQDLKAKSLPSLALDNQVVYKSFIPGQEELITEIEDRFKVKNNL